MLLSIPTQSSASTNRRSTGDVVPRRRPSCMRISPPIQIVAVVVPLILLLAITRSLFGTPTTLTTMVPKYSSSGTPLTSSISNFMSDNVDDGNKFKLTIDNTNTSNNNHDDQQNGAPESSYSENKKVTSSAVCLHMQRLVGMHNANQDSY
jgi:hypothetical protein